MPKSHRSSDLPLPFEPRTLAPSPECVTPRVWMRRLTVVRSLVAEGTEILRDVWLRRGLNIVWARPAESGALVDDLLHGHAAGKTTFCRLLRYVLGEPCVGTELFQASVRARLPRAWVLAEVCLPGEDWLVARPLDVDSSSRAFATQGTTIDTLLARSDPAQQAGTFEDFLGALSASATLPTSQAIPWSHLLQWSARDQEARFAGIDRWRDPSSESGVERLTDDGRQQVMRSVLMLMGQRETEARTEERAAGTAKSATKEKLAVLHSKVASDLETLEALEAEGQAKSTPQAPDSRWSGDNVISLAEMRTRRDHEDPSVLSQKVSEARARARHAAEKRAQEAKDYSREQGRFEELTKKTFDPPPPSKYCPQLLVDARRVGCPLLKEQIQPSIDFESRRSENTAKKEVEDLKQEIERRRKLTESARAEEERLEGEAKHLESLLQASITSWGEKQRSLIEEEGRQAKLAQARSKLAASKQELKECEDLADALSKQMKSAHSTRMKEMEERSPQLRYLSDLFSDVVQYLLGVRVKGEMKVSSGGVINLHIFEQGERTSLALTTLKVLAFDLLALVAFVEGKANFPGLLIHDSPREADLDQRIHERLFSFATKLEQLFRDAPPSFQYIVTTTAPPPADLQKLPYLVLEIGAATPAERLLRVNL